MSLTASIGQHRRLDDGSLWKVTSLSSSRCPHTRLPEHIGVVCVAGEDEQIGRRMGCPAWHWAEPFWADAPAPAPAVTG